MMKKQ